MKRCKAKSPTHRFRCNLEANHAVPTHRSGHVFWNDEGDFTAPPIDLSDMVRSVSLSPDGGVDIQPHPGMLQIFVKSLKETTADTPVSAGDIDPVVNRAIDAVLSMVKHRLITDDWMSSQAADDFTTRIHRAIGSCELIDLGESDPVATQPSPPEDELRGWWLDKAHAEIEATVPKAVEYGATDLIDIGTMLARTMRRSVTEEEAAELGVFFYLIGKIGRWQSAIERGERPSDDTLLDIGVYVRMAQRIRDAGGWPGIAWVDDDE